MQINHKISTNFTLFVVSFSIATAFLNLDSVNFQPVALWAKLIVPAMIGIGGIATARNIRVLRPIGWIGILLFLLVSVVASFPSEDYLLGGPNDNPADLPRAVSDINSWIRVIVGLLITALLFWRYRRLQASSTTAR